jgi:tetratricopeptide (TPR) repeat protein
MIRFLNLVMVVGALCAAAPSALAQERRPSPGGQQPVPSAAAAPEESPKNRLDRLFDRLKAAKDAVEARALAEQIMRALARSGSDTADLLMTRVGEAIRANEAEISLDLLDTVLALQPNWAEAFARRASVHIQRKDYDAAMRDLRAALALEPRHFMALAGLGSVLGETGNPKRALAAFREALKVHPHMEAIKKAVERLAAEHDGRDI